MKKAAAMILAISAALILTACARLATHPTLRDSRLPYLIPTGDFLARGYNGSYKVSPDGMKLGWLSPPNTLYFKTLGTENVTIFRGAKEVRNFRWAEDSRRMLISRDNEGDENWHIFLADTEHPNQPLQDLTPFANTQARIFQLLRSDPEYILITHNQRDKTAFDLYRLNLTTGVHTRIAENPGDTVGWITAKDGALLARIQQSTAGERTLEIWRGEPERWDPALAWSLEETMDIIGHPPALDAVWALSNRDRDRLSLVRLDLTSGEEEVIYEDPRVDLSGVSIDPETYELIAAWSCPDYWKIHFFDKTFEADFARFHQDERANISMSSVDNAMRMAIVTVSTERSGTTFYLLNRETNSTTMLSTNPISRYRNLLSRSKPITFTARDGLKIHGYLTIPVGTSGKNLPMVLMVHGGPYARDIWGFDPYIQFLANRGYALLQVNYRGSWGYGRAFMEAGIREFSGKMHDDLIDAVQKAVDAGIADPKNIAIFGSSYGGYATLVGLTFTPDVFAAGVDIAGPSDLVGLVEDFPTYAKGGLPIWYKYVGNPNDPEDRRDMQARSPLYRLSRVKRPLLVVQGGNDVRVLKEQSDQIVAALREAGNEVEYLVFSDEGHGISRWQNELNFSRALEDFLAKHLGGRSGGFDWVELIQW